MYNRRILPIGIQSFEKLRDFDAVYVDKTIYTHWFITPVSIS